MKNPMQNPTRFIPKSLRFGPAGLCLAFSLLANYACAQVTDQWWDNNGASAATSGTWDTTTHNWAPSSTLTASTVPFTNGNFPEFAAGTVPISALTITVNSAVTCAGLANLSSGAYVTNLTFSGNSSGSITIVTNGGTLLNGGYVQGFLCGPGVSTVTINVPLIGAGGVQQHNSGSLALYATNTYSGGTAVTGGQVIYYNNNGSFGSGPIYIGATGNAFVNSAAVAVVITNAFAFPTAGYLVNLAGGNPVGGVAGTTFSGPFPLPSGVTTLETSSTATEVTEISGVISGSGAALTVSDAGTLQLGGVNTYTGATTVSSPATLSIVGSGSLGSGSYSGLITNASTFIYNSSAAQTLSGTISGAGSLIQSNSGTLTLSGANTFTGAITNTGSGMISANTIADSGSSAIGLGTVLSLTNGGTLQYTGAGAATAATRTLWGGAGSTGTIDLPAGNLTWNGAVESSSTFTLKKTSGGTLTLGGTVDNPFLGLNIVGGKVVLNKTGSSSSVQALGEATTVGTNATLQLSGTGTFQINTTVPVTVSSGGILDMNSQSDAITSLSLSGAGSTNNSFGGALINSTTTATSTLTCPVTLAASATIGGPGNITLPGVISGGATASLTYAGAGTLTLGGANSYTGGTIVSSGTLGGAGAGSIQGNIAVNGTGTLDGSAADSIQGNVTVSGTGTLELDSVAAMSLASTITVGSGTTLYLNYAGIQTIASLTLGSTAMPFGTYNAAALSAAYPSATFSGSGSLQVGAPFYWDANATDAGSSSSANGGGSANWDNSTNVWWISGSSDVAWSANNVANFGGTAGTVTVNANVAADGLTFIVPGYSMINTDGVSVLTLGSAAPVISVPAGSPTAISCVLGGGGALAGMVASGPGTLALSGANTYTGGTVVTNGVTLSVNAISDTGPSALGPYVGGSVANTLILSGGTLAYTGAGTPATGRPATATAGFTSTIDVPSGVTLTMTNAVTGSTTSWINKVDSGTLVLGGTVDNSSLLMNINGGTVILNKTVTGHGLGGGACSVNNGATLQLSGNGYDTELYTGCILAVTNGGVLDMNGQSDNFSTFTLAGTGPNGATYPGALINSAVGTTSGLTNTGSGVVLAGNTTIGGPGNIRLGGISGAFSLTNACTGTLTLSNASTYSGGTTISGGGTLALDNVTAAGTGVITIGHNGILNMVVGGSYAYTNTTADSTGVLDCGGPSGNTLLTGSLTGFTGTINVGPTAGSLGQVVINTANNAANPISASATWNIANGAVLDLSTPYVTDAASVIVNGPASSGNVNGALRLDACNQTGPVLLNAPNCTIGNGNAGGSTISGVISDNSQGYGFTFVGFAGGLTLTAPNTYGGATVISNKTLTIGGGGCLGVTATSTNYATNLVINSTFNYASSAAQILSGVISGPGVLTLSGSGTLTLSGANTYAGGTTITDGTLGGHVSGSIPAGIVTVGGVTTALELDSATAMSPAVFLNLASSLTNGAVNLNFSGTQNINGLNIGGVAVAPGTYGSSISGANNVNAVFQGTGVLNVATQLASVYYWDETGSFAAPGGGGTGSWNTGVNDWWISGGSDTAWVANSIAWFAGTAGTVTLGANQAADELVFTTTGYTVTADTITLGGSTPTIIVPSTGTETINSVLAGTTPLTLQGAGTLVLGGANTFPGVTVPTGGTLQVNAAGAAGSAAVTNNGTLAVNIASGILTNTVTGGSSSIINIIETAADNLTLNGNLAGFTGTINSPATAGTSAKFQLNTSTLNSAATVNQAANGTFYLEPGVTCAATVVMNGYGNTEAFGAFRLDNATQSGPVILNGSTTIGNDNAGATTISGPISDGGHGYAITKEAAASSVIILSATNTFSGPITNQAGTLVISGSGSLGGGSYAGGIVNTGFLIYASSAAQTLSGIISGSGALIESNSGPLTLSGANTYTGNTTNLGSTLIVGADNNLGTAPASATVGSIMLSNATLSANNTFTLNANRGITFKTNSTLDVAGGKQLNYAGIIAGTGNLTKTSPGILVLGGNNNSYTGNTIISAGVLQTGGDHTQAATASNLGVSPSAPAPTNITLMGGTLQGNNANFAFNTNRGILLLANSGLSSLSGDIMGIPGPITGSFGLTISNIGSGVVYLTGTNTYTGNTIISTGLLSLQANGSLASSSMTIDAAAGFDVSKLASSTYTMGGSSFTASGSGTVTNVGTANAAIINGAAGGTVSMGSLPITLNFTPAAFNGDATHPSLYVVQGTLQLNGNAFTVNNASGTALGYGTYALIQQNGGSVSSSGSYSVSVIGSGIVSGATATIQVSGATVNLLVYQVDSFSNLVASQSITYGTPGITLTGTVSTASATYPPSGETITVTINGNAQTTTISDSTGDFSLNYTPNTIPASVTPYAITYSYAGDTSFYPATNASTTLTVNKAPLSVTANNQTKTYGQTVTFGSGSTNFTSTGLQNGQTIGTVTLAVSGNGGAVNAPVSGSPYTITPSAATGGTFTPANYTAITYNTGTLTVGPATLTVTAAGTLVYGQDPSNAVYTAAYAPFVSPDTAAVVSGSADFSTDATATNYVGTNYTANVVDTGTLTATNYSFVAGPVGILTITPAPLTVTNVVADSMNYDGTNIATLDFTGAGLDGFVNGDGASVSLVSSNAVGLFASKNAGVGLTVTISGVTTSGDLGTNYTVVQPTATATIFQLPITVYAVPDSRTYDGGTDSAGDPTNYPALAPGDSAAFTQAFASRNAGTGLTLIPAVSSITDGNGGANYSVSLADNSSGIIAALPITVAAVPWTKPYDGNISSAGMPTVTPSLISPDTGIFTQTYDTPNAGTGKTLTPAAAISDGNGGANYSVTLTVNTNGVVLADSLTITANAQSKTYGTALSLGTSAFTVGAGLVNPEAVTAVILTATGGTAATDPVSGSPYTITPSGATGTGGFLAGNYNITYVTNSLTVNPLTVILTGTRDYDGTTNVPFGDLSVSNAVGTDDVNVAFGSAGLASANAGTNAITSLGTLALGGSTSNNYTLAGASGAVVVTPLPVVLTGGRPYDGTSTAAYTVLSIANVVGLDDVSLLSGSVNLAGPNVGPEAISSPGSLALTGTTAPNYTVTGVSGTVTIAPVALSITASGQSKTYGTALSLGTSAFSVGAGLVSPETVTAVVLTATGGTAATDPVSGSPYTITPSAATGIDGFLAGNYDITYNTGALTVNPLAVILSGTRPYDGTATALSAILSVANAVGTDDVNVAAGSATLASGSVGSEAITSFGGLMLGGVTATNYTLTSASGSVLITNPYLPFSITSDYIDSTGTNFVLVWQSVPGVVYQVMGSTNLSTWTAVGSTVTATATTVTNAVPISSFPINSFFDVFVSP